MQIGVDGSGDAISDQVESSTRMPSRNGRPMAASVPQFSPTRSYDAPSARTVPGDRYVFTAEHAARVLNVRRGEELKAMNQLPEPAKQSLPSLLRSLVQRVIDGLVPGLIIGLAFGGYMASQAHPLVAAHIRGGRPGAILWGILAGTVFGSAGGLLGRTVGGAVLTAMVCFITVLFLLSETSPVGS
jgi:hypothetical protein